MAMIRKNERGVALVMTLILLSVLSAITITLVFLSRSETWASANYRLMSQARDGAEAGINAAANFILNNNAAFPYTLPATGSATDAIGNYTTTAYPVQYNGNPVVLSADS